MESKMKLKDVRPGDQIQLGKYTCTMVAYRGVNTGVFVMDTLLDKLYPRVGFRSRGNFMNIVRTEPDFQQIVQKITDVRLLYEREIFPHQETLHEQYDHFCNLNNRIVGHRSRNIWPDLNLLMDYDGTMFANALDPETGKLVKVDKYTPCGVRLLIEVQRI